MKEEEEEKEEEEDKEEEEEKEEEEDKEEQEGNLGSDEACHKAMKKVKANHRPKII